MGNDLSRRTVAYASMTEVSVTSYVTVPSRCPMRYHVVTDHVEFSIGSKRDPFEFMFDADALREFLRIGQAALQEVDQNSAVSS